MKNYFSRNTKNYFVLASGNREVAMPTPNEKLAKALEALQAVQAGDRVAIRSRDLSRSVREDVASKDADPLGYALALN